MTNMLRFDAEAARRTEAAYTTPELVAQRREVLRLLALQPGESVLDIGSGPGFLAAEMAAAIEPDGRVFAVDPSESMRELARSRNTALEIRSGSAEALPLPDDAVDVAVATQVLEYVPDVPRALAEMYRVLKPGGRALILDTDWASLVWHAPDEELMRRVLVAWDEHLVDPHLPRTLGRSLVRAGFQTGPPTVLPLLNVGNPRGSFSGSLLELVSGFVVDRHGLDSETVDAWAASMRAFDADWFFSLNRYVFLATRPLDG